jgi:hypothetical protein
MRRTTRLLMTTAAAAALVFTTVATAEARPRPAGKKSNFVANKTFGLGFMLGAPTGLSGKYFLSADTALDFGIGVYGYGRNRHDDDLHVHVDFLWHPVTLIKADPFWMPLYFGIGGRIWNHDYGPDDRYDHLHVGVRAPIGIAFDFQRVPLDIFFELALILDFASNDYDYDHDGLYADFTGAIGVRYYFN